MPNEITKFQMQEKIRRLYFKHRGNINAIIEETGLDEGYIRKITSKIKKGFRQDVNFEIACFVTDAILEGREQRMIRLEDRLNEILNQKRLASMCCGAQVTEHKYEGQTWYRCERCKENCTTVEVDLTNDNTVLKYIDKMRKEDEFIGKWLATMGIIMKENNPTELENVETETKNNVIQIQSTEVLPPAEKKMLDKLSNLTESQITEIRRALENKIDEATSESQES